MRLKIVTPERTVFEDEVDSVTLPARDGEITILPHHIPLVSLLMSGVITVKRGGVDVHVASSGGFVEVLPDSTVQILADTAEQAEELSWEKVEEAKRQAETALKGVRRHDEEGQVVALGGLERELARLKALQRRGGGVHHAPHQPEIETES